MKKIINYGLLVLMMLFSMASNIFADNQYGLKDKIQDGVILHCFDWTLSDIKAEIPNIAKAGFTAVQTSPLHQKEPLGAAWYMLYQPYDYIIGNGLGSEADLKALCQEAHNYGVKVIVDVVANHTNGNLQYVAPFWQDKSLYHTPFDVSNWNDRNQVTHGKIGMWDIDTNNSSAQGRIKAYISALKACGVDGIRWDAIKHIGLPSEGDSFMKNVVDQSMYNYGEILDGTGGNDSQLLPEYQQYMSITDNTYGNNFAQSFNSGSINSSTGNFCYKGAATNKLVYWGESHDTYSNSDGYLSKYMNQNVIDRAYAIVAGNNGATALYFSRPSATAKDAIKVGQKGSTHFTSPEVAEVNKMHNLCAGEANYYVHTNDVGAQVRKSGAIIVRGNGSGNVSVANGAGDGQWLKAGTYTDHVGGATFTVTNATISGNVGPTGIAVLYNATPVPDVASVTLSPADGTSFSDETLTITATPVKAKSAWVQVAGASKQSISTATSITIGQGVAYGSNITVTWGATGEDGKENTGSATYKKVKQYEPILETSDEISCFLETANDAAGIYAWNESTEKVYTGAWPGATMTLVGKTAAGKNVFKWTYTGSESQAPSGVIFLDGKGQNDGNKLNGGNQVFKNHGYYVEGAWNKEITKVNQPAEDTYVYYDNAGKWQNVYCYFYKGKTSATVWPGEKMTLDASASYNGKNGWYKVTVPAGYANAKFVINNGTPGTPINGGDAATSSVVKVSNGEQGSNPNPNPNPNPDPNPDPNPNPNPQPSLQNLDAQYQTNPNGVGIKKTITVDGDISDWNSSMLIAQGAANDDPRVYRDNSMYENPIDLYALYGCYDDNNLYLMWEMTNVQDVVAPDDNYPLTQGVLWQNTNCPVFIAINTNDVATRIGNNCKTSAGGTIWDSGISWTPSVNKVVAISYNGANGPFIYGGDSNGINPVAEYTPKASGVVFKYGMGILSKEVKGIDGAYGTNNGRVVGDMTKGTATYVDFNTKGHNSGTMDFHFEMSIPLSTLGITANDIASKGLGVNLVATFGISGMDCLPYDTAMNDNADQPDTKSQEFNSFEKSDEDNITVPFAYIGKMN